jgi:hypothetical protein
MTNKELQHNAIAISEVIAKSGVSSEELKKADSEISNALRRKKSFTPDKFLDEVKKFLIGYGFYLTDMVMTVTPMPVENEYGFIKYAIGKRQMIITGEVDWIDKEDV